MPFLTVKEIAARLGRQPATVRWWLVFLRQGLHTPPAPGQTERRAHGQLAYRADYVAVLEQRFGRT